MAHQQAGLDLPKNHTAISISNTPISSFPLSRTSVQFQASIFLKRSAAQMVHSQAGHDEAKTAVFIDPYNNTYQQRCKRQQTRRYLPQEIIFQFLLHLPAQILYHVTRHVSREWSLIIRSPNFAHHHLRNSTSGLLIQPRCSGRKGFYLEMRRGHIEMCEFDCGFNSLVWTSCNGLVVISNWGRIKNRGIVYVANPLTKQLTALPPFSRQYKCCGLAFAEGSMVYKVVRACGYSQIAVVTIGVDTVWRHIDIKHLLHSPKERVFDTLPVVSGGYVHWVTTEFVLTLNVETEIVSRFYVPPFIGDFLPLGSNLSFVSSSLKFYREVWEMNSATGEWTVLFRIKKRALNARFKGMFTKYEKSATAWCWLAPREVLFFALWSDHRIGVTYNINTQEFQVIELESKGCGSSFNLKPHVNSLLWWE